MYDTSLAIEQNLAMLAATPSHIVDLTDGLLPAQLLLPPEPGAWSARDVLAHLRACSDMWGNYILVILNEDRPTFKAVNPRSWIKKTDYLEQEFHPSLQAFTAQRAELLTVLKPLPPQAWFRTATVTGSGKPRTRTVHFYAQWLANHEHSHFKQLEQIINSASYRLKLSSEIP